MNRILSTVGLWKRGEMRLEEVLHDPNTYFVYLPRKYLLIFKISLIFKANLALMIFVPRFVPRFQDRNLE